MNPVQGRAMVVGAGGWLGRRLVTQLLAQGRDVLGVDLSPAPHAYGNGQKTDSFRFVHSDIAGLADRPDILQQCTTLFNCAGVQHPRRTAEIYRVNRDSTVALFRAAQAVGVGGFVHISSINAVGPNPHSTAPLTEATTPHPTTHYGLSKLLCDRSLTQYALEGTTRLVILRPGVFYGADPSINLRQLLHKLQTGRVPVFTREGFLRTFVDVDKVVEAALLAEAHGHHAATYLIGDAAPLSTLRFYQVLAQALHAPLRAVHLPVALSRAAERIALLAGSAGVHLRLPTIAGEFGRNIFCSVEKAKRELGFQPHTNSEDGLQNMVRSITAPAS